ncbi:MAG: DUF4397 domain-containing protein [Nocardioides sp.]
MSIRSLSPRVPAVTAVVVLTLATATGPLAQAAAPSAAKPPTSLSYVVQGVPAADVDVSVDGESVARSVGPKEVVPLDDLAPGEHTVSFSTADWTVESTFDSGGGSQDVVLHWPADASNEPVVTTFANDVDPVSSGEGRLTVAHTAVVPPADILANGDTLFTNIANGEFVTAEVPSDTYKVAVVPTGGGDPLLGPVDLPVADGSLTRVFAIGAPRGGSMDAVVQVIPLRSTGSAPTSVNTGSAGLVDPSGPTGGLPVGLLSVLGVVLAGAFALRRQHARP